MATELAGARLSGRYAYERELGRGASGRVVLARDTADGDAPRAIKLVSAADAGRLRWELDVLRGLQHPGLPRVFELVMLDVPVPGFDAPEGAAALVTELAAGDSVAALAAARGRDAAGRVDLALAIGERVAAALAALHANGLVHGDVKPDNIVAAAAGTSGLRSCVLVDFGLTGERASATAIAGTPGYMAPELLRGERDAAADVYALGATLHHLLRGAPPADHRTREPGQWLPLACRSLEQRPALPDVTPDALRALLADMLAAEPGARPNAREVRARLLPLAEARGVAGESAIGGGADSVASAAERAAAVAVLPLEGREAALDALTKALAEPGAHVLVGPPGSGRSRLARESVWRLQAARVEAGLAAPTYRVVDRLPDGPLGADTVLHLEGADEVSEPEVAAALRAADAEGVALALLLERQRPLTGVSTVATLAPLERGSLQRLLERALPGERVTPELVQAAQSQSGGLPGRLCRQLAAILAAGGEVTAATLREPTGSAADRVHLPAGAAPLAEVLSLSPVGLTPDVVDRLLDGQEFGPSARLLRAAGLAVLDGPRLRLRDDVRAELLSSLPAGRLEELAALAPGAGLDVRARVELALAGPRPEGAEPLLLDAIERARAEGDVAAAGALARMGMTALGERASHCADLTLALADALRARGDYREALAVLDGRTEAAAEALRAELHRLDGERDAAATVAEGVVGRTDAAPAVRASAAAVCARIAFDHGRLDRALELAQQAREMAPGSAAALRALEVEALALLHRGEHAPAAECLRRANAAARGVGDRAAEARFASIGAQLARGDGDIHGAARQFARAFELAEAAGEQHAAASFLHNVGAQRLDCGEPGPAIVALREAARRLARLGRDADLGRVLYNLGYAAQLIGVGELAADAAVRARAASQRAGDAEGLAHALALAAEQAMARGDRRSATANLDDLPPLDGLSPDGAASVGARAAGLLRALGAVERAESQLDDAERAAGTEPSEPAALELALARAAFAQERGERTEASEIAEGARLLAERVGTFDAQLRALLLSARTSGDPAQAGQHLARVRALLDTAARGLEPADRARLRAVDAYRTAFESAPRNDEARGVEPGSAQVRRLAGVAKRLAGERRPSRLYELILDAAVELAGAERGYLVLLDRDGRPRVRAGRGIDRSAVRDDELSLSRSIVSRVLGSGRPLSTMDAAHDERLSGAASVHALSLRSVLAVPLRLRGEVGGAIYLEDRLRPFAFGDAEQALLGDLSDLAGLALDSAGALRAERRALRRQSVLRARLSRTVEAQAIELSSLKRATGAAVEGFEGIVAESPAMDRVLSMVRKVASSPVPVLVRGESGTGKELIARALHAASDRASRSFVSENCGAIPETLLESTLFGHVRGAFTGADRRRQGLFEVADGGTLFLDEIGEMSPAMQARLLRVLQDGEVRAVGADRGRHVDVRVVAATHRDLDAMVADGSFREDLYYRLAVVNLELPPLRQRPEDIPVLVAHFVRKHAPGGVSLESGALAALAQHTWPGNVRQLENEIRRALVLADGRIGPEHLSENLVTGDGPVVDPLDLKGQVNLLERRLIRQALQGAAGNQTRAARVLGVSRYGLQKMIRRLGIEHGE